MFEGDGYSEEWAEEAAQRGLNNLKTTPEALKKELDKKFVDLYEELGIYTHREIEARNEIKLEKYSTVIAIEGTVLADISRNHIIPCALNYQNRLIENVKGLKEIFGDKDFRGVLCLHFVSRFKRFEGIMGGDNRKVEHHKYLI